MAMNGCSSLVEQRKIAISMKSQDGDIMFFRIAPDRRLYDLFKDYCKRKNFKYSEMSFILDGARIQPKKTAIELGIEDGDELDAMKSHDGGGNSTAFA